MLGLLGAGKGWGILAEHDALMRWKRRVLIVYEQCSGVCVRQAGQDARSCGIYPAALIVFNYKQTINFIFIYSWT